MNEKANISRALSSCTFADEIVVVDGGSTDGTLDILKAHEKVVLIENPWENHFARQRQISLDHCTGDWVIRLDTDEAFPMKFEENIRELLESTADNIDGYKIRQCNLVGSEAFYSKSFDDYENIARIWRNLPDIKWERQVHEVLTGIRGTVNLWDVYVVHYGFLDRQRYWQKGAYYSQLSESGIKEAAELYYRDYDMQPRPRESKTAHHVPAYNIEEVPDDGPEIAIMMRPNPCKTDILNYGLLTDRFSIALYLLDRPGLDIDTMGLPAVKLTPHSGNPTYMIGLEHELFDKDIYCIEDLTWSFSCQATIAKLKFGKKLIAVMREHNPFACEDSDVLKEMKQFNRKLVDVFVAMTVHAKEALLLEGVPDEKITVIPQGTDTVKFCPDREAGQTTRKELGIADDDPVVLFAGELLWEQGIFDVIHASRLALIKGGNVTVPPTYVVAGSGAESDNVMQRVQDLGMNSHFIFIKECPDEKMPGLFNAADIFVIPGIATRTWHEQFSAVLIQAMACGIPVIGSASGAIEEVAADAGILVQPNDPFSLSAAIMDLLADDIRRKELGSKGRERVLREYDAKKSALKFEALFSQVFQSTFRGAVRELSEYTGVPAKDVVKRIRSVYSQQIREWEGVAAEPVTQDVASDFYHRTDSYLYDLVQYNYENPLYTQSTEAVFEVCENVRREREGLQILDFGGGIGSQLISLSMLNELELSYADIPGQTFDYAAWRFGRRNLNINMIDASKKDFLENRMFDVVIALDVVEHLVDPEATVRYLVSHIKPDGFLIVLASFVDNKGEAKWHLNVDKFSNELFYEFIKSQGMDMVNNEIPRLFQKNEEIVALREEIELYHREKRVDDARRSMECYLQMRSVDIDMRLAHANLCLSQGDPEAALDSLDKVLLFSPDMPEALDLAEHIRRIVNEGALGK